MSKPFHSGDRVLFIDQKERRYLVTLEEKGEFHSHAGFVAHVNVIGLAEGVTVESTLGAKYVVMRPTLEDFVLEMPRGAQVIYPKDLAPIAMLADIGPGQLVFESGIGSGALSMTMLRAGARIVGYELREDFASRAKKNVASFLGDDALGRFEVHIRDSYAGIETPSQGRFDRAVLDLPEPWQVVPHLASVMHAGGVMVAYTPSITQAVKVRESLSANRGEWVAMRTLEVLHRTWHIEGEAVRPDHRMVAHTAFLTTARLLTAR
ncbi:MAG: tRNA (adenine-N1)-methyltransferase [Actinobacteria bacterium]|nr:tRNA (adenine-N1)-methyltransferase [Actinomycetota bacterium]